MTSTATQINSMSVLETRNVAVDMSSKLDTGETLTGIPDVTSGSNQTITKKAVNDSALTINAATVAIGEAIQFTLNAAAVGVDTIYVSCSTSAGQIVDGEVTVTVC